MTDIYCAADHVLLKADYSDPEQHCHWAKHLIISLSGKMECSIEANDFQCHGIMIASNIQHTIKSNHNLMLVYLFDETSDISVKMEQLYFRKNNYFILDCSMVHKIRETWLNNMVDESNVDLMKTSYPNVYKTILKICGLSSPKKVKLDSRILQAMDLLQSCDEISENTIHQLAKSLYLSQSRLSHLFKEQIGVSLNSFLVLIKIQKAYQYIFDGDSITEAALKARFNSSSHFVTINKANFGISANQFHRDARLILP